MKNKPNIAFKVDQGLVRKSNDDQAIALMNKRNNCMLIVCDGMGAYKKGDFASSFAIETFKEAFLKKAFFLSVNSLKKWTINLLEDINDELYDKSHNDEEFKDCGTTFVMAFTIGDKIVTANMGDSRVFTIKDGELVHLTKDQTLVSSLVAKGKISESEAKTHKDRHYLTNALGCYDTLSVDFKVFDNENAPILVCSDGLYNNVTENEICAILKLDCDISTKVTMLINAANNNGGSDNIGISLWEANSGE